MSNFVLFISLIISFMLAYNPYTALSAAILLIIGLLLRLRAQKYKIIYFALSVSIVHLILTIAHISVLQNDLVFYISQVITYAMMFTVFFISTEKGMARALAVFNIVILLFYFVVKMLAQDAQLPEIALAPIASISIVLGIVILLLSLVIFVQDVKKGK